MVVRAIQQPLAEALGQPIVVENRGGAGGSIGTGHAARQKPDGYTILMAATGYVVNPSLYEKIYYDPLKDFAPVAEVTTFPVIYTVRPDLGVKSMQELIAYARTRPGGLNYATPGAGTLPHLAAELLKLNAGIEMVHIPYAGAGPAAQALLSKTVDVASISISVAKPQIDAGNFVGLAVSGGERWPELPDVPTIAEAGIPAALADTWQGLMVPAGTPKDIVDRLARGDHRGRAPPGRARTAAQGRLPCHRPRARRIPQAHRRGTAEVEDCDRERAASPCRASERAIAKQERGDDVTSPVLFETRNDCLDVILNRPDEGNLITNEMGQEIARTLRAVGPQIKLIRLRGNGANFSKGRQAPKIDRETMTALDMRHHIAEVPLELYGAVKEARAPTLAIVQGEALGVGCALAAVCDITIAADNATFQVPELEHNIAPTLVMWAFLNRVPYKTAAYLVYSREKITAQRAELLGLVTKVVPAGKSRRRSRGAVAKPVEPALSRRCKGSRSS